MNFDLLETVIRENYAIEEYELPEGHTVDIPPRLLTGEYGPEHLRDAVFTLNETLPESQLVELDGVGHVAIDSAPIVSLQQFEPSLGRQRVDNRRKRDSR